MAYTHFIAIDPGTDRLGIAVFRMNAQTRSLYVEEATTFYVDRALHGLEDIQELYGNRAAALEAIRLELVFLISRYRPMWVACESPFLGRFPQAFAALTECIGTIRAAVISHGLGCPFYLIDPKSVKRGAGVSGGSKDKDDVAQALLTLKIVECVKDLDEHTTDAIAVGWTKYQELYFTGSGGGNECTKTGQTRRPRSSKGKTKRRKRRRNVQQLRRKRRLSKS